MPSLKNKKCTHLYIDRLPINFASCPLTLIKVRCMLNISINQKIKKTKNQKNKKSKNKKTKNQKIKKKQKNKKNKKKTNCTYF